jgi:hypothetical protein
MWLDDCRIPFLQDEGYEYKNGPQGNSFSVGQEPDGKRTEPVKSNDKGRFTPNLLVCDDMLNDGSITETNTSIIKPSNNSNSNILGGGKGIPPTKERIQNGDKGSNSRYYDLDLWFDKMIDKL